MGFNRFEQYCTLKDVCAHLRLGNHNKDGWTITMNSNVICTVYIDLMTSFLKTVCKILPVCNQMNNSHESKGSKIFHEIPCSILSKVDPSSDVSVDHLSGQSLCVRSIKIKPFQMWH